MRFCRIHVCPRSISIITTGKSKRRNLKVGDKVLVLLPKKANKLLISWKGPFEVVKYA